MARPNKEAAVAELAKLASESSAILLTEYRGLSVAQLKQLRRGLGSEVKYAVAKNKLSKLAMEKAGCAELNEFLVGPTAITFVKEDPVAAAKELTNFAKANPQLVIKAGMMDGNVLSVEDIKKLASLESREVLLAKSAGVLKALMYQAAYLFTAPASKAVRTVDALREKQESAAA